MAADKKRVEGEHGQPLVEHLTELRNRIIWSLVAAGVGIAGGLALVPPILRDILLPQAAAITEKAGGQLILFGPTEVFSIYLRLGVWSGLIMASPIIMYQAIAFVVPALLPHERRMLFGLLPAGLLLFGGGVAFGYFVLLPATLRFLLLVAGMFGTPLTMTPTHYINLVVGICLPLGITFELPVVVWILASLGIVGPSLLRRMRRFAILAIFVLAAIISPGTSPIDQALMAAPLLVLYEVSILIAAVVTRRRARREAEAAKKGS